MFVKYSKRKCGKNQPINILDNNKVIKINRKEIFNTIVSFMKVTVR